jgi:hypothetical protein
MYTGCMKKRVRSVALTVASTATGDGLAAHDHQALPSDSALRVKALDHHPIVTTGFPEVVDATA